jgi:hypothetical protein
MPAAASLGAICSQRPPPHRQHHIEPRRQRTIRRGDPHHQLAVKEIRRLGSPSRQGNRTGWSAPAGSAPGPSRDSPGPAGVEAGHDGAEGVAPFRVGKDVSTRAEPLVVVLASVVGPPQVHQGTGDGPAGARQHRAGKLHRPPAIPGSRRSLRGLKKGPLGLMNGRLVPVMTGRGRRQVPLGEGAVGERARGGKGAPIGPLASLLAWPAGCSTALCTETSPDSAGVIPVNSAAVFRRRPRPRGSGGIGANAKASPSGGDEPGLLRLARHV